MQKSKFNNDLDNFSNSISFFKNYIEKIPDLKKIFSNFEFNQLPKSSKINGYRAELIKKFLMYFLTDEEKAKILGLPNGVRTHGKITTYYPENLSIGEHCWIGDNAVLDATGGLTIGSHTTIGHSVFIWTHSSHMANLCMANQKGIDKKYVKINSTKIGSGCFISGPSVILPGVSIGEKSIVSPFSTVNIDIPPRSIFENNTLREGVLTESIIKRRVNSISHFNNKYL